MYSVIHGETYHK